MAVSCAANGRRAGKAAGCSVLPTCNFLYVRMTATAIVRVGSIAKKRTCSAEELGSLKNSHKDSLEASHGTATQQRSSSEAAAKQQRSSSEAAATQQRRSSDAAAKQQRSSSKAAAKQAKQAKQ